MCMYVHGGFDPICSQGLHVHCTCMVLVTLLAAANEVLAGMENRRPVHD